MKPIIARRPFHCSAKEEKPNFASSMIKEMNFQQCNGLCRMPAICCDIRYQGIEKYNIHSTCFRSLKIIDQLALDVRCLCSTRVSTATNTRQSSPTCIESVSASFKHICNACCERLSLLLSLCSSIVKWSFLDGIDRSRTHLPLLVNVGVDGPASLLTAFTTNSTTY